MNTSPERASGDATGKLLKLVKGDGEGLTKELRKSESEASDDVVGGVGLSSALGEGLTSEDVDANRTGESTLEVETLDVVESTEGPLSKRNEVELWLVPRASEGEDAPDCGGRNAVDCDMALDPLTSLS